MSLTKSRDKAPQFDFSHLAEFRPKSIGLKVLEDYPLEKITPFIDWSPFFWTWELKGKYPQILQSKKYGEAATKLYEDAQEHLATIVKEKLFRPKAVYGLWPAEKCGDAIHFFENGTKEKKLATFHFLRQQAPRKKDGPHHCLADWVAGPSEKNRDYCGGFVVTMGDEVEKLAQRWVQKKQDDYTSILIKALGDRLAEAFAELIHLEMRKALRPDHQEGLTYAELLQEKYMGIRPAIGYPACPDHSEKEVLWGPP